MPLDANPVACDRLFAKNRPCGTVRIARVDLLNLAPPMNSFSIAIGKTAALVAIAIAAGGLVGGCLLPADPAAGIHDQNQSDASEGVTVKPLWGDADPPGFGDHRHDDADANTTGGRVAGRSVVRLSNVSRPELHIYRRDGGTVGDTAVVVCPGGGFSILAWDLEGIEVAKWLNSIGVTAGVLKYRVPTNRRAEVWKAPLQDAQRAISTLRSMADELGVDKDQIGVMGFSAGAIAAARTGLMRDRQYDAVDPIDQYSCYPNFMALIYAGGLIDKTAQRLKPGLITDAGTPPAFMVHAFDDRVLIDTPVVLLRAMKAAGVRAELHVFDFGGHGYGVRRLDRSPVTAWPDLFQDWLKRNDWVSPPEAQDQAEVHVQAGVQDQGQDQGQDQDRPQGQVQPRLKTQLQTHLKTQIKPPRHTAAETTDRSPLPPSVSKALVTSAGTTIDAAAAESSPQ